MATFDCCGSGSSFWAEGASSDTESPPGAGATRFHGVLFEQPERAAAVEGLEQPDFFVDLNLDQVLRSMTAGREQYELKAFFYSPLHEAAAVRYRHEVLRDLEKPDVHEAITTFAETTEQMREHLAQAQKLHYPLQKQAWFLDAVEIYCGAVRSLAADLAERDVTSRGLQALRDYLADYAAAERFASLAIETHALKDALAGVRYTVRSHGAKVTVSRFEGEADYSVEVEQTFAKFQQGAVKSYLVKLPDFVEMDHVEAQILDGVAQLHPEVFGRLADYCARHRDYLDATVGRFDREGRRYTVHKPPAQRWTERLPFANRSTSYSFTIPPRDDSGFTALEEIRGKGINPVANAVAQSADHIKSFFAMLRLELAFYLGCLNLHERLREKGEPTCFPTPLADGQLTLTAESVYDVCLTLHLDDRVVGNDVNADGKSLVMITGANQGGKSTLLRSLGVAQLMMQSGMFAGGRSLRASVCTGVFTHYKREEDAAMESGKLDEELRRMSAIADHITPRSILLCNESFASTNEREGSEIARQVVRAMLDKQVTVLFVTHMYDLAHSFHAQQLDSALFLRAERDPDGRRTFKVLEGEPLPTSYGEDSYRRIFGIAKPAPATIADVRT